MATGSPRYSYALQRRSCFAVAHRHRRRMLRFAMLTQRGQREYWSIPTAACCGRTVNSRRNMNQNVACTASSQRNTTATDACDNVDVARPASHRVRRSDRIAMNRSHRSYAPPGRDGSCSCNAARPAAPLRHARIVPLRCDVINAPLQSLCETAWAPPQLHPDLRADLRWLRRFAWT